MRPRIAQANDTIQKRTMILRLGPAQLLEVVVDRRHQEDALPGALEVSRPG